MYKGAGHGATGPRGVPWGCWGRFEARGVPWDQDASAQHDLASSLRGAVPLSRSPVVHRLCAGQGLCGEKPVCVLPRPLLTQRNPRGKSYTCCTAVGL